LHAPLLAAALTAPLAGALFLPLIASAPWLYPAPADPETFKSVYLTPTFVAARTLTYFALWTVLASWAHAVWGDTDRMKVCASAGLIIYAVTGSLAGVDWLQALTPRFHSSIYGLLFLTFQMLAGFAFAVLVALRRPDAETHQYGAILVAALLLWAYNHAMQYIIIWSGNMPNEAVWYMRRETGAWGFALWGLFLLQFVAPFSALLSHRVRRSRQSLLILAAGTLALRLLEAAALALPGIASNLGAVAVGLALSVLMAGIVWWAVFVYIFDRLGVARRREA
jgi:hypothetical protein